MQAPDLWRTSVSRRIAGVNAADRYRRISSSGYAACRRQWNVHAIGVLAALGDVSDDLLGRYAHAGQLTFDRVESGFPVYQELLEMANDALQAERHLASMPSVDALKDQMVRTIVGEQEIPTKLQYALSQRLYYEELARAGCFGRAMIRRRFGSGMTMIAGISGALGGL